MAPVRSADRFYSNIFATFGTFPPLSAYEIELTAANDESLLQYIRAIAQDELVLVHHDDADFAAASSSTYED